MRAGATTSEELEWLFEDVFVLRDRDAVTLLFEAGAVLVAGDTATEAHGRGEIAQLTTALWDRNQTYLAAPRRVLQAIDTTLVLADGAINVLRRGGDRRWRYAISVLNHDETMGTQNR